MSTTLIANTIRLGLDVYGNHLVGSYVELNPELNVYFDCNSYAADRKTRIGRLSIGIDLDGELANTFEDAGTISLGLTLSSDTVVVSQVVTDATISLGVDLQMNSMGVVTIPSVTNWVMWSKIGDWDFVKDHSNEAGDRPMSWPGQIYRMLKLNQSVIVYGKNGISVMRPKDVYWSEEQIFAKGTMGKQAQINIMDKLHFFLDTDGCLWQLSEGFKRLGYEEYFSSMTAPVISYEARYEYLYITDGTDGYVYSIRDDSLTEGSPYITGIIERDEVRYVVASDVLSDTVATFTTGIFDFETRKEKTIFNLELGFSTTKTVQVAIMYRTNQAGSFSTTPWATVTQRGIAYLPCYGVDFKFKFSVASYEDFSLEFFKINGVIHGFSFLDSLRKER